MLSGTHITLGHLSPDSGVVMAAIVTCINTFDTAPDTESIVCGDTVVLASLYFRHEYLPACDAGPDIPSV
jgi:hypothetical protein